jgi:transposase
MLFSLFQTLCLWRRKPRLCLTAYLTACAEAAGQAPERLTRFLPWQLSEEDRQAWSDREEATALDTS